MAATDATIEAQPAHNEQPQSKAKSGWRLTLTAGTFLSLVVLILNLSLTLWAIKLPTGSDGLGPSGRRVIFEGSCSTSRNLNTFLHLLINILSSILLGASSYGMQCLSAPTRAEIDGAHARGKWMDVGVLSVRNLGKISLERSLLWGLLALSSVPLRLMYNSVVYSSLSVVSYTVHSLDEQVRWNRSYSNGAVQFPEWDSRGQLFEQALEESWDNLTALECIDTYATGFQTRRSHVILMCDERYGPIIVEDYKPAQVAWYRVDYYRPGEGRGWNGNAFRCQSSPFYWICPRNSSCEEDCRDRIQSIRSQADDWQPFDCPVKYCLSKPVPQFCRVNFSTNIAVAILVANVFKVWILAYTAFYPPKGPIFVLGDAIQTFLEIPDEYSRNICLASSVSIETHGVRGLFDPPPPRFYLQRGRWGAAISGRRWMATWFVCCVALGVASLFLGKGMERLIGDRDLKSLWNLGFGTVSEKTLMGTISSGASNPDDELVISVLVANAPQLSFSILYLQYNGLFTKMLSAKEWSDFGRERKAIRVSSSPTGAQRYLVISCSSLTVSAFPF